MRKYKRWISFFWGSWKYERNGSRAKLTWDPLAVHEPQENEIHFLNNL